MTVVERTRIVTAAGLENLVASRNDVVRELAVEQAGRGGGDNGYGPPSQAWSQARTHAWTMEAGPFDHYRRTLEVGPADDGTDRFRTVERTEFKFAVPLWWIYLLPLLKRAIAGVDRRPRRRFWWPREVVSAGTARMIGSIGTVGAMAGFMGVLIGQTITFAAQDFGAGDDDQANTLAAARVGVLLSLVLLRRADRTGRRPLILGFAAGAIGLTMATALAPNLFVFGATQTLARGLTTGLLTLITLACTEEVPASSRALAISFATLATGFGAAIVIWLLPLAELVDGGWRLIYLVPGLFVPLLWWLSRTMPETRRFVAADSISAPPTVSWRRFALVGVAAFASSLFLSPVSQLRNEFLRGDLGYSATQISAFQLLVSLPATASVPVGGILADRFGRRWVGALALAGSSIALAASYQMTGPGLWIASTIGMSLSAAAVPALRGYQTELFPTRARGRVGGLLDVVLVSGSALGLVVVGALSVRWDDLGQAIGVLVFGPLAVAVLVIAFFPETANRELEEFNPGDPRIGPNPAADTDRTGIAPGG